MGRGPGRTTAADTAYTFVRGAILRGELAGGTMLSENELAAQLSMSRTPVRAALVRLEQEGWVAIYPQRGALVRSIEVGELQQSAQMRHALEVAGVHGRAIEGMQSNFLLLGIIAGAGHGFLTFYDLQGRKQGEFVGHTGDVWSVAVSPDASLYRYARRRRWPIEEWGMTKGMPRVRFPRPAVRT